MRDGRRGGERDGGAAEPGVIHEEEDDQSDDGQAADGRVTGLVAVGHVNAAAKRSVAADLRSIFDDVVVATRQQQNPLRIPGYGHLDRWID